RPVLVRPWARTVTGSPPPSTSTWRRASPVSRYGMAPELTKLRSVTRTLLTAGHVLAGDPPREGARALLVKDERIAWVGDPSELRERVSKKERVDLGDAWVMPGLIDP